MKKILFLTPFVPSNRAGGENFTKLLLEQLSQNNKIDLLYYRYADDPKYVCPNENVTVVQEIVNSSFVKLKNFLLHPFYHPIFSIRFNRSILNFLRELVAKNEYDLLYLDHSQMALYGKYFPKIKKILMSHDVMAQRFLRKGNPIVRKLILKGEGSLMNMPNATVFSFSDKDNDIIKNVYGIDGRVTNFFLDKDVIAATPKKIEKNLVFFGKWKRPDNFDGLKWFFDNVYGNLSADYTIKIVGKWLPEDFENQLKNYSNVEYLGFVDNPYEMIADSYAVLSPLFSGAGVKVKVVESLACGTPVIGNEIAFEGISKQFEEFMIYASSADDYVHCIEKLNDNLEERQRFKEKFIRNYRKQSISSFIEEL